MRRRPAAPVRELELDDTDGVFGEFAHAARLLADAAVHGLETIEGENTLLDDAEQAVLFLEREIAAGMHDDLAVIGLDLREKFHAAAELSVGHQHGDQKQRRERESGAGTAQRKPHRAHVGTAILDTLVMRHRGGAAEHCAERGREEQRNHQRGRERGDQGDRQIFHELADHTRPEQERRKRGDAGRRRGDHRSGHALGCERIGLPRRHAFRHAPLGEFRHDDGVVDQHPDGEDERKQDDDIDGQSRELQPEHAGKERSGYRDPDEERGAQAKREQNHDRDQQHAGQDRVLQIPEHLPDDFRFVLRKGDVHGFRPRRLQRRHRRFHGVDRLYQVGARALGDLDGHGRVTIHPRDRGRILEGRLDLRDVEQPHRGFGRGDDRDLQDVLRLLEQRRHLDGEAPGFAFQRAGSDECVEGLRDRAELVERESVARQQHRIENDLHRLIARPAKLGREHPGRLLNGVLGGAGNAQQRALGHVARKPYDQHRIKRQVDLEHLRLVDVAGQVVLGLIHLRAHICQGRLGVEARFELEQHEPAALEGGRAHLLHVADRFELGLERPQQ